ncbi:putative lipid II flippase FtsW [Candidatus Vallotia tarda]|uniref:Probable peptidoglycan glycosyltransferase FtsW n=1 Tax=Candidatus Vallotiella hemipterorum TaxID=1177213 RepID=A0A916JT64_9BURK|nr:putative lipid II flippase FtsW [Candidatus Vallotia tarda]CAG7599283.1 Lipid II flippase FtsW [Candidatus Vallotia tarda]
MRQVRCILENLARCYITLHSTATTILSRPLRLVASEAGDRRTFNACMCDYDYMLLWATIALLSLGLVMVYSASIALPNSAKYLAYMPYHFLIRHIASLISGALGALLAFRIPIKIWNKQALRLFLIALLLLVLVLIPYLGKGVNGARRWISLGITGIQPSEIMKLAVTIYAANYTVRKQEYMQQFIKGFLPMALSIGVVGAMLLLEPDVGAFVVIVAIAMGVLFLGGIGARLFSSLALIVIGTFCILVWLSPWRRERIFAYLNPWDDCYSQGKSYQLIHSLIAFGRGGWFGVGLGRGLEKLNYLPEAHTDFILAVIGEELGFFGVIIVVLLFYWIVRRAFEIGHQACSLDYTFAGLVAKSIGLWIGTQTFINMSVNLGLLPTKGLTLPLVSYGGSGILINCISIALLMRIDYENKALMRGGKVWAYARYL